MYSIYILSSAPYDRNPLILPENKIQKDQNTKKASRFSLFLFLYAVHLLVNEYFQLDIGLFNPLYLLFLITFHVLLILRAVFRSHLEGTELPNEYLLFASIVNAFTFSLLSFCYKLASDSELLYWLSATAALVSLLQTVVFLKTSNEDRVPLTYNIV